MVDDDLTIGTGGTPTPPASGENSQPSAIDYDKLAQGLEPVLAKLVERQWQSGKDKRIADLTGKVDSFQTQLERYAAYSGQKVDSEALRQMRIDDLLAKQSGGEQPGNATATGVSAGTGAQSPGVDVETLQALDLDPNSPEVAELLRRNAPLGEYVNLVKRRKARPAPSPAAVMPQPGGVAVVGESLEELTAELERLMQNPSKNWNRIQELSAKQKAYLQPK